MLADLDLLLIAVFCTADDLLPERPRNARRMLTDAEVVTLCVAQAIMGIPSDQRFLAVARKRRACAFFCVSVGGLVGDAVSEVDAEDRLGLCPVEAFAP